MERRSIGSAAGPDRGKPRSCSSVTLTDLVAFLSDPHNYPSRPRCIETLETHFAWVFFTPRLVYKLKKPLRQDRMDYRTLMARKRGCLEELRLNRRLAPTVYRSLECLSRRPDGGLQFGPGGQVEEYLVKMRRLPRDQMLDRLVARGAISARQLTELVRTLARFFAHAKRHGVSGTRYLAQLQSDVAANRRALRRVGSRLRPALVEQVATEQLKLIDSLHRELAARAAHIVEGHGDLRAEHICLGRTISVIDCLEFDRDLRRLDPVQEIALLALEIERLGDARLAQRLLQQFCALSGAHISWALLHFYISYNAMTRAKLAGWHVNDPQFPDARPWVARAREYLRDALRHARSARLQQPVTRLLVAGRPMLQQLGNGLAADRPHKRLRQQRSDRQYGELGIA
jgi:uncharacterized protein